MFALAAIWIYFWPMEMLLRLFDYFLGNNRLQDTQIYFLLKQQCSFVQSLAFPFSKLPQNYVLPSLILQIKAQVHF